MLQSAGCVALLAVYLPSAAQLEHAEALFPAEDTVTAGPTDEVLHLERRDTVTVERGDLTILRAAVTSVHALKTELHPIDRGIATATAVGIAVADDATVDSGEVAGLQVDGFVGSVVESVLRIVGMVV